MNQPVDTAAADGAAGPPAAPGWERVQRTLLFALFAALFLSLTIPAYDSDFWWHLATGRWMFENHSLLAADPFDFTSAIFGSAGQVGYQLTQYWLAQVLMYAGFLAAGLKGVVLLRAAVFTALFVLLYRLLRRSGAGVLPATLLLALGIQAVVRELDYIAARPQMWSSLFFVALLLLLEQLRDGKRWAAFALPPFMLLWANLHGGYILGVIVIAIATAAALLSRLPGSKRMLLAAAVAVALTGLNPSGYDALFSYPAQRISSLGDTSSGIFEEESLFKYRSVLSLPRGMPALAAAILIAPLTLLLGPKALLRERRDLLAIYLLTLALGLKAARYLVFLVPMACWVSALNLAALRERLPETRWRPLARRLPRQVLPALTIATLALLAGYYGSIATRLSELRPAASFRHPAAGAADYLLRNGVTGNLFNEYVQGGYLAWRLHPGMKVFIYGRMVYPELLALYNDVVSQPTKSLSISGGKFAYFYQKVFNEYAVDTVVIPAADSQSGDVVQLVMLLARDDDWALVSGEPAALVFLRKTPAVAALTARALPKTAVYDAMIAVALAASRSRHGQAVPVWRRALAIAYNLKGQKREALRVLDEYLALVPGSTPAIEYRNGILKELARENR